MSVTAEWVGKAEGDYKAAVALNRRRREPLPDVVCYHCQQCAEKYLKAYLVEQGSSPPLTHDLRQLLQLCAVADPSLAKLESLARFLNPFGVMIRYPGFAADTSDAKDAVKAARRFRVVLRRKLGL